MTRRSELTWALCLCLLAFAHRLMFLLSNSDVDWPFSIFYEGDGEAYFHFARAIIAGQPYQDGLPFHPPGFAYFLAGVHQLFGAGEPNDTVNHFAVRSLLTAVSSLSIGLIFLLVRPYLGPLPAIITALLCTWHFGLYVVAISPVTEGLYLTLYLLAWLWFSRSLQHLLTAPGSSVRRQHWHAMGLGSLCGLLALTRAEALLLPFIFVGLLLAGRFFCKQQGMRPVICSVALALAFCLTLLPWTLHNRTALQQLNAQLDGQVAESLPELVPVTVYGPLNLALANNAGADGTFSRDLMSSQRLTGNLELTDPQHLKFVLHGDAMAIGWIGSHPTDFLVLIGKKWELTSRALTLGWTQWNWPGGLNGVRQPVDVFSPDLTANRIVLLVLLGLGAIACWRAGPAGRQWLGLVMAASLIGVVSTTLFFGYVRQGLLLVPLWFSLVAAVLSAVMQPRNWHNWHLKQRTIAILGILVVVMFSLEFTGIDDQRNYRASGTNVIGSNRLNRDQPMRLEVLPEPPSE